MEKLVWEFIKEQELLKEGQNIGAATSGGPDSMALLVCLCSLAKVYQFHVFCVHFEHGIRGEESLRDADFVAEYCDTHHIPLYMGAADVPALAREWGASEETAAKRAREGYFNSLVESGELSSIATAHHREDNAESVLMHLLRGSGLDGLTGIHSRYGALIRPFLCLRKRQILQYLKETGTPWVEDRTNRDDRHTRNYIRNVLLPQIEERLNPGAADALNRLSATVAADADYLSHRAEEAYRACVRKQGDRILLDAERLNAHHTAISSRIVRLACADLHVIADVEYAHILAVLKLARSNRTGTRVNLAHQLCAEMEYGTLILGFAGREKDYSFEQRFDLSDKNVLPNGDWIECEEVPERTLEGMDGYCECLDADKLPARLVLRTRHAGDVIRPLHCEGGKKLKDFFIDRKLSRETRAKTPLLADGSNIIWVVGHVISEDYCVDETTRRIVRLRYRKKVREDRI